MTDQLAQQAAPPPPQQPDPERQTLLGAAASRLAPVYALVNSPKRLVLLIIAIWVACSLTYAALEDNGGPIDGLWWGIVTGSTVGYGDYYPESDVGRVIAAVLIVSMLILVPIAIGHVIAKFVQDRNQFTHDEQVALAAAVQGVHSRVELLELLVIAGLTEQHGQQWVEDKLVELREAAVSEPDAADEMLALFQHPEL